MTSCSIGITGSHGYLGRAASAFFLAQGYSVLPIIRSPSIPGTIFWDVQEGRLDLQGQPPPQVVMHFAGANVGKGRWSSTRKRALYDSRIPATRSLAHALAPYKLSTFLLISAVGYYGTCVKATEDTPSGSDFLARLCVDKEEAAGELHSTRLVIPRLAIVLSPEGGLLRALLPWARLGLLSPLGPGNQWMSWIGLSDLLAILQEMIQNPIWEGPVNVVSPYPVQHKDWIDQLCAHFGRTSMPSLPTWLVRALFGREKAEALLLSSAQIIPDRLLQAQWQFRQQDIDSTLAYTQLPNGRWLKDYSQC